MVCKFHAFMTSASVPHSLLIALLVVAGAVPLAHAERSDRGKPMNIEAEAGRYDDAKQIGTFTGNVVVTKGSIVIRAGQIEVRQTPEGTQTGIATASAGKLATFRQKRDGVDETIEGEAERIEYDSRADTVRFINRAVVRRYRGTALADETAGNVIKFDNTAEVFSVEGGASAASPGNPGGRVRAVLTPRDSNVPLPSTDAASAPGLKASPSLGDQK